MISNPDIKIKGIDLQRKSFYVTRGVYQAWVNKIDDLHYNMWGHLLYCRDYLCEFIHNRYYKIGWGQIYGLRYIEGKTELDEDKTRLVIQTPVEKVYLHQFEKNIHEIEEANGFEKTIIHHIKGEYYLLEADRRWQQTTLGISGYTLYLRHYGELNGYPSIITLLFHYKDFLELCKKKKIPPSGHPKNHPSEALHSELGVIAWTTLSLGVKWAIPIHYRKALAKMLDSF